MLLLEGAGDVLGEGGDLGGLDAGGEAEGGAVERAFLKPARTVDLLTALLAPAAAACLYLAIDGLLANGPRSRKVVAYRRRPVSWIWSDHHRIETQ